MSDSDIEITADCPVCGARIAWDEDATDKTMLVCNDCGLEAGTLGNLKAKAAEVLLERLRNIEDASKGR